MSVSYFSFFGFILLFAVSCSSSKDQKEIVSYYENGQLNLVFVRESKSNDDTYKEFQYYEDGSIAFEGAYVDRKKKRRL